MNREAKDRKNLVAVNLSLAANVALAGLKTTVGVIGRSPALLADGINSTCDVAYLVVVRIFMGLAEKPPDREHPYGHRQLESIAAVVVGAFVVTTGIVVLINAVDKVYELLSTQGHPPGPKPVALWVALLTLVLKIALTTYTKRVGQATGSIAVLAVARDHRNDIFSATAAALGVFFGRIGYVWVDPAAAALVALVILRIGVTILRESSADLMDVLPNEPMAAHIRRLLAEMTAVEQVEEIHVHRVGIYLLVDITIGVDGTITVAEGDQIASRVEQTLRENIEYLRRVSVHYHPSRSPRPEPSAPITKR